MRTDKENDYFGNMERFLQEMVAGKKISFRDIAGNFSKYAPRQQVTRFLVRHELFKMILDVKGSVVECGVFAGDGLMTWAQLSAIYEPYNYHREMIGFDTFEGFPCVSEKDIGSKENNNTVVGGICSDSYEELNSCIEFYDQNRALSHVPKVKLVKGDFLETGAKYIEENKHSLISLLYLDFDLYEPTIEAMNLFLPRMSRGSLLVFDEIHNPDWPGETVALLEKMDLRKYEVKQFHYDPNISYIVL